MTKRGPKNSHNDLSQDFLREVFSYNPVTGELRWAKVLSKRVHLGDIAGCLDDQGRIKMGICGKDYFAHRVIWCWMTGKWPDYEVDHINEKKADNRWENLREATPSENHRNRGKQRNNTTGYKGVAFDKRAMKYIAGVKLNGKRHNLGQFDTAEDAYAAYCEAGKKLHGKFFKPH